MTRLREIWKYGGEALVSSLHTLTVNVWECEKVPKELRDGIFIPLHKKENKLICDNYRGISLLSVAGKVLSQVIMMHLEPVLDEIPPETQCGFHKIRSCMLLGNFRKKAWSSEGQSIATLPSLI